MARIRRWKEKLLLVWFALFTSVIWARPRSRTPKGHSGAARSFLVTGSGGNRAWGITLSAARPFVRAFSASAVPVALPAAVGAFAASAGAMADLTAEAAAATNSSCTSHPGTTSTCETYAGGPCTGGSCRTVICESFSGGRTQCLTCDYGSCGNVCIFYL